MLRWIGYSTGFRYNPESSSLFPEAMQPNKQNKPEKPNKLNKLKRGQLSTLPPIFIIYVIMIAFPSDGGERSYEQAF